MEIYFNYFKGLEGYSKVEVSLYKLMEDDSKTKINSSQLKENYIKGLS